MLRYMIFSPKKIRIIHLVLKYLCSDNANFMAIFLHYIPGHVVFQTIQYNKTSQDAPLQVVFLQVAVKFLFYMRFSPITT